MIFEWRNGLIWVLIDIVYDNKHIQIDNCIIDTGSATTAIDIDLVDFNFRKPGIIRRLHGIGGGIQEVVSQNVDLFEIGNKKFENVGIEFGVLQDDYGVNGFIGNNILSRFIINIDYYKQEIDFKPR